MPPKTALITGGNGITGSAILSHLSTTTTADDWSTIIVTSYSPFVSLLPNADPRVRFVALDFTQPTATLVPLMRAAGCDKVTHAYFSSYVHRDDFGELATANESLFENFVEALLAVTDGGGDKGTSLQNITLQTGGKYYMVHARPGPTPAREDEPRRGRDDEDNFYYQQEDYLKAMQARGTGWTWNVMRPVGIIGCTGKPNGMNIALTLAVYFAICASLDLEARMPTNALYWNGTEDASDARLLAEQTVWASTSPGCTNEAFNAANGDHYTPRYMWPRWAAWFEARASSEQTFEREQTSGGSADGEGEGGVKVEQNFSLAAFLSDKRAVWDGLCERAGRPGAKATFDAATPALVDWAFRRTWGVTMSMSKARARGWTGYVDSYESWVGAFERFRELGQIP